MCIKLSKVEAEMLVEGIVQQIEKELVNEKVWKGKCLGGNRVEKRWRFETKYMVHERFSDP